MLTSNVATRVKSRAPYLYGTRRRVCGKMHPSAGAWVDLPGLSAVLIRDTAQPQAWWHLGHVFGLDCVCVVFQADTVDAMPLVGGCWKLLALEDVTQVALRASLAVQQRDAVAKHVYAQIFDHIVLHANKRLDGAAGDKVDKSSDSASHIIGILDIFGFEVFQSNSFEQLCINYCNERLQTFFNTVIFKTELEMYEAEGVDCAGIAYQDNLGCVKVIDGVKNTGVFSFLEEECVVPL